jgi:hypothetical protein
MPATRSIPRCICLVLMASAPGFASAADTGKEKEPEVVKPEDCDKVRPMALRLEQVERGFDAKKTNALCETGVVHADTLLTIFKRLVAHEDNGSLRLREPQLAGLPTGTLQLTNGTMTFDLRAAQHEGLQLLRVEGPGMAPFVTRQFPASGVLEVPIAKPVSDKPYKWGLTTTGHTYSSTFTLVDDTASRELAQSLARIREAGVDGPTRMILEAAAYDEAGIEQARERLIRELRAQSGAAAKDSK